MLERIRGGGKGRDERWWGIGVGVSVVIGVVGGG